MSEELHLNAAIPGKPGEVYAAWLDGEKHTAMTGGKAECGASVGDSFTAWDGYITGTNLELEPGKRIVQSWRTTDFPEDAPDSQIEVILETDGDKTNITLHHTNIPEGQAAQYRTGWPEHYFEPMKTYFSAGG